MHAAGVGVIILKSFAINTILFLSAFICGLDVVDSKLVVFKNIFEQVIKEQKKKKNPVLMINKNKKSKSNIISVNVTGQHLGPATRYFYSNVRAL